MWNTLKKYFSFFVSALSAIALFFDFKDILKIENMTLRVLLYILLCVTLPICIYSVVSLFVLRRVLRRKDIVIDNINLVTINHEFDIHEELIKQTKNICVESVSYIYEFVGRDFSSIRTYKGKCVSHTKEVVGFPLVVAGDSNASFADINCYAYDLMADAKKRTKLYPNLLSNEGLYKFACYNFSRPLRYNQEFNIETHYTWPDCVSPQKDYILVSPIFCNKAFDRFNVELRFFNNKVPIRVKKYMIDQYKRVTPMGEVVRDARQAKPSSYISFTDTDVKMQDAVAFYVYIYDFV